MSDILIRGMEIPDHCLLCFAFRNDICAVAKKEVILSKGIQEWCPLVEIPSHGNLIDRDKLMDVLGHEFHDKAPSSTDVLVRLGFAPTVIESEEKENECVSQGHEDA